MQDLSRRQFIGIAGGIAAWLAASPAELRSASPDTPYDPAQQYRVLTAEQAAAFDAFSAQVIPSEPGSPGARDANVVRFADNALAGFARKERPAFEEALVALANAAGGGIPFASLGPAKQIAVMRALERSNHDAFEALRGPAIAGMFCNPGYGGNANKAGWKMLGFQDAFSWQPPFGFYDTPAEMKRRG